MLPFLRPLGPPRPATLVRFLRFSTTSQCHDTASAPTEGRSYTPPAQDRNLTASRTAEPSYPPSTMRSNPRPKTSKASRRTNHPTKQRPYPTRQPSHHQPSVPTLIPREVAPLQPEFCAPNLPYFVSRSENNELPVYQMRKRGGNLLMTRIKRVDGDKLKLRDDLREELWKGEVVVNSVTGHIMIKGHVKGKVEKFLRKRLF